MLLLLFLISAMQSDTPDSHAELLARIRRHMAENLSSLPNYTCRETIERTAGQAGSRHFGLVDRLRLEVAYVGGRELFAWPGASNFEDRPIEQMVGGGAAIGAGNFASHARAIFASNSPEFSWAGEQIRDGIRVARFDFRVPRQRSRYAIQTGARPVIVAYEGYLEADAATLDPLRLELRAIELPDELRLRSATESMEYTHQRIGQSDFLLPVHSQLSMTEISGRESLNKTHLDQCRQYAGESTVRFDIDESVIKGGGPADPIEIPPGLVIETTLRDSLDSAEAAVGDPVSATVIANAKKSGRVIVPKGAVITGRITKIEVRNVRSLVYLGVGLSFTRIDFGGRSGAFSAEVESAGMGRNYAVKRNDIGGETMVYVETKTAKLTAGTRVMLRTR